MILKRLVPPVLSLLFLFYCVSGSAAIAQESKTAKDDNTDQEAQKKKQLETRTFALLDNIAASVSNLKLPENRVHAEVNIARLYWRKDSERTKAIYRQIANDIIAMANQVNAEDPNFMQNTQMISQLRTEAVQSIIPFDPKAALDFLRATKTPFFESQSWASAYPLDLQLQAATGVASSDPATALAAAEETLGNGYSPSLSNVVQQLLAKDSTMATRLANEIVDKMSAEDLLSNATALNLDFNMLNLANLSQPAGDNDSANPDAHQPRLPSGTITKMLELLVNAAMKVNVKDVPDQQTRNIMANLFNWLAAKPDAIQKYLPSMASDFQQKLAEFQNANPDNGETKMSRILQNGSPEDIMKAAANVPKYTQEYYYSQASQKAIYQGNIDQALAIIENNIKSPDLRDQQITLIISTSLNNGKIDQAEKFLDKLGNPVFKNNALTQINNRKLQDKIDQNKLDEVLSGISRLPNDQQIGKLVQLVSAMSSRGKKEQAIQLADRVWNMIPARAANQTQMQQKITIVRAAAVSDVGKATAYMQSIISQLNDMINAAESLNGFDVHYFKEDEMLMQGGLLQGSIQQCGTALATIAVIDFDAAKGLAEQLQTPEARILAQLSMVAQLNSGSLSTGQLLRIPGD